MLDLYHNINSVCAQKVRIALAEKSLAYSDRVLTLRGDQYDPAYLRLNPNAVVPTLVHEGRAVIESSVILYYLDEAFPDPALMPVDLHARARVRQFNKLIDEYVHNSCVILTFGTAFRARFAEMDKDAVEALLSKTRIPKWADYKRDVIAHGLGSQYIADAIGAHHKMLKWMDESLESSEYLAGPALSLADIAVIPYIYRLELLRLARMWSKYPSISAWYERVQARPSYKKEISGRMSEVELAPFNALHNQPDPWLEVEAYLKAT